ncbi:MULTISPECIES: FliM/FliN family flagellar motor switch protein [Janthinobacterium]|uniref:FliM/FliN family flagellar motor switch protein n=1 Tax=Janthinobacterium TaxID=29580 RepID=UPI001CD874BB|nr:MULTISPECIES: FliM/FliN family flagellar motor switch protein [Janthinobacterium]MCA1859040.1 FliM/FliN family flagellar motor switch protein [Janthinobacterium lividum]
MTILTKTDQTVRHQVLDSCLLGRPVHLLHVFGAQLRDDLAVALRQPMSRRYWGNFQIDAVTLSRVENEDSVNRWLSFSTPASQTGFALERQILLSVLNYRYGSAGAKGALPDPAQVRVTATEERLAVVLGQQLVNSLISRVHKNLQTLGKSSDIDTSAEVAVQSGVHPVRGSWIVTVALSDVEAGQSGQFWFSLDKRLMADVLRGLLPERAQAKKALRGSVRPLASRLQVTLEGRLVSKQVQLGALFDLRVGDVIPVSLSRTDVMLDDSRLFTAAVSEHKGKLCLTSFEDVE